MQTDDCAMFDRPLFAAGPAAGSHVPGAPRPAADDPLAGVVDCLESRIRAELAAEYPGDAGRWLDETEPGFRDASPGEFPLY